MKRFAYLLIVTGILTTIIAFNLDVTVGDSGITNMNLMAQRQNLLIVGCVGFLAGVVLLVGGLQLNNSTENKGVRRKIVSKPSAEGTETVLNMWTAQDRGGKFILVSILLILLSFCFSWEISSLGSTSGGYVFDREPVGLLKAVIAILLWLYPCYVVISKGKSNAYALILNTVLSGIWIGVVAYRFYRWHTISAEQLSIHIDNGTGFWLALLATGALIIGTVRQIK